MLSSIKGMGVTDKGALQHHGLLIYIFDIYIYIYIALYIYVEHQFTPVRILHTHTHTLSLLAARAEGSIFSVSFFIGTTGAPFSLFFCLSLY